MMLRTILIAAGFACAVQTAAAQGVLHQWPVTGENDAGTVLTAEGSASGRGLTAIVAPPVPLDGADPVAVFDGEIVRQMGDAEIVEREDILRAAFGGLAMLLTSVEYETESPGEKKIAIFAASSKPEDTALRIIRADGPYDKKLMDHYASDVLGIAQDPDAALAGTLKIEPHSGAKPKAAPVEKIPAQTSETKLPAAPEGWARKVYSDAVFYWPTAGPLARGSKTGYLSIMIYNPMPLNGQSIDAVLSDFSAKQERNYDVQRREAVMMDGPHRAWDYLRSKNKNGVYLNVSYLAIRTGGDSIRIVKETLTDDDHDERYGYVRAIERLYRHIENETTPAFRAETAAATTMHLMTKGLQTESRGQRRERLKRAKGAAQAQRLNSISSQLGQGIPLSDIAGVFLRSDFLKRAYGGKDADYAVFVLLKDGSAYVNPTRPPSDIDIAGSRRVEPSQWVQWRKSGKTYQIRADDSAPWKALKGGLAKPAPAKTLGFRGKHIAAWGNVLSGTAGHRTGSITLTKGGRYETSSFALAGGSGITGLPAAVVSSSTGKEGRSSTSMSNVAPALLNNTKRDPNGSDFTGQYALRGYTAEFLSDSGKLSRTLFLMNGEGGVYVGGRYYSVPKK